MSTVTATERVPWDEINLSERWDEFLSRYPVHTRRIRDVFLDELRLATSEPEQVDEIQWCGDCNVPHHTDDGHDVAQGFVCNMCFGYYTQCSDCGEYHHEDDVTGTLEATIVCEGCLNDNWTYCEDCEGYYQNEDDHHHHDGCDCVSPQLKFVVRNDGHPPLAQDERVTVTLPKGIISGEGLEEIRRYIYIQSLELDYDRGAKIAALSRALEALGDKWQTKEGNYTKRLSKLAYQTFDLKVPPEVISQVGSIASAHSAAISFEIELTRDLNLPADEFFHDDSCWWGSFSESRCTLKSNGGFAIRSFNDDGFVSGRAWVLPLKKLDKRLTPTFETLNPDAFVTFNGYGRLSSYSPARILGHMAGMTYRKIGFSGSPMYVNSGGYLVAPEEIATKHTDGNINLELNVHASVYRDETAVLTHA